MVESFRVHITRGTLALLGPVGQSEGKVTGGGAHGKRPPSGSRAQTHWHAPRHIIHCRTAEPSIAVRPLTAVGSHTIVASPVPSRLGYRPTFFASQATARVKQGEGDAGAATLLSEPYLGAHACSRLGSR